MTWIRALVLLVAATHVATGQAQIKRRLAVTGERKSIEHDGADREYRIHVPESYSGKSPVPLLLFLHGGGGNADQASRMGMTGVADKHRFIVVYPSAIDRHWNDGRDSERYAQHDATIDDVAFVKTLVRQVSQDYRIDATRVFAAGVSNGGFMSGRLAIDCSEIFAGVGIIIATMGEPLSRNFAPEHPVSVLFMNGTKDPLVPYDGGEVKVELFPGLAKLRRAPQPSRGKCIATDDAIELWLKQDGLAGKAPVQSMLADKDTDDGSKIEHLFWAGGEQGTAVALYRVIGGGHAVPGGTQYLPERLVGRANRDIDGLETVWQFFAKHGRDAKSSLAPAPGAASSDDETGQ